MNLVWDRGECSVADVWKVLQERPRRGPEHRPDPDDPPEREGLALLSGSRRRVLFAPTVSRDRSQQSTVQRLIETVFNGSAEELVLSLLHGGALSTGEVERLRRLIASLTEERIMTTWPESLLIVTAQVTGITGAALALAWIARRRIARAHAVAVVGLVLAAGQPGTDFALPARTW